MSCRRRRIPHWLDIRPPRQPRPITTAEAREFHAVRLALMLALGVIQAGAFAAGHEALPGDQYDHARWLRDVLRQLGRRSPTAALAARLINIEGPRIAWDDPRIVRRHLVRLAAEAERMGWQPRR